MCVCVGVCVPWGLPHKLIAALGVCSSGKGGERGQGQRALNQRFFHISLVCRFYFISARVCVCVCPMCVCVPYVCVIFVLNFFCSSLSFAFCFFLPPLNINLNLVVHPFQAPVCQRLTKADSYEVLGRMVRSALVPCSMYPE